MRRPLKRTTEIRQYNAALFREHNYMLPAGVTYQTMYEHLEQVCPSYMALFPVKFQKGSDHDRARYYESVVKAERFHGVPMIRQDKRTGRHFHVQGVLSQRGIIYKPEELCELFQHMHAPPIATYDARAKNQTALVVELMQIATGSAIIAEPELPAYAQALFSA